MTYKHYLSYVGTPDASQQVYTTPSHTPIHYSNYLIFTTIVHKPFQISSEIVYY